MDDFQEALPDSSSEDMPKVVGQPMQWYDFLEDSLASWAEQAQGYRLMHEKSYSHYNKISFNLTIPAIILSTLTGVANFGQESLSPYLGSDTPLYIGVFSIAAAILSTIAKYVRADEKAETHRSAMIAWDKLYRTIVTELTQPRDARTDPQEFLLTYREERHRLSEQSPTIPYKIRDWFRETYKLDFAKGNISPPNILSIGNVEVYRDRSQRDRSHHDHNSPPSALPRFATTPRNSPASFPSSSSAEPHFAMPPTKSSFVKFGKNLRDVIRTETPPTRMARELVEGKTRETVLLAEEARARVLKKANEVLRETEEVGMSAQKKMMERAEALFRHVEKLEEDVGDMAESIPTLSVQKPQPPPLTSSDTPDHRD
jgi:hypothetical protein